MNEEKPPLQKTAEKANTFVYKVTKFDENGWADAQSASPIPLDLVTIETHSGKTMAAWWNYSAWEGRHLKKSDTVLRWKRRRYEHIT